ncbi:MAG: rRNA maturation RNase YbeY [Chloroflexi bacterium]|nr:rRNA maturation RNase YbeY [Chloroflexota bacterium]
MAIAGATVAHPTEPDRTRALYVGACRIDLVRRGGTARLLSDARLARSATRALEAAGAPTPASVTIVLTDDEELRDLNFAHLDRDEPTDVLSFPMLPPEAYPPHPGSLPTRAGAAPAAGAHGPATPGTAGPATSGRTHIGDVAISVERAIDQAEAGRGGQTGDIRWSPADELRLLVTHGVLHLCGWDHAESAEEAAMRALEQRLLAEGR